MKIYLAGFYDTRARLIPIREAIRALGHTVTSTWLDEPSEQSYEGSVLEHQGYAIRDLHELDESDLLIVDTFDITPRGGREVEYGYMLGLHKPAWVVGPQRNIFHHLSARFVSWDTCLAVLSEYGV